MPENALKHGTFADPTRATAPGWVVAQAMTLILAGCFVYSPVLHGAWLWDDADAIVKNPVIHAASGLWQFWFDPPGPDYFPITSSLEWLLWRCFGNDTLPFHVASMGLHIVSGFLLWRLFLRIGLRLAWFGALLFVVHPLAVESVAWISELKNTASLPLFMLSLLAFLNYDESRRPAYLLTSLGFFLAALLTKTSVVMLPFVLLLFIWWKHGRLSREDIFVCAPYFAVALIMGIVTILFQREWAIGGEQIDTGGFIGRIVGAGWAIVFYFFKCIAPFGLLPMYPQWSFTQLSSIDFVPWLLIIVVFSLFISQRRSWGNTALLGFGFFVITLMPVLGFINMSYMGIAWVADHFTYLPMIGLIGLVAATGDAVLEKLPRHMYAAALTASGAFAFVFALMGRTYAADFRGPLALWSYAMEHNPGAYLVALNMGGTYAGMNRLPESVNYFEKSLELNPDFFGTHVALADALARMGRFPEAETHYLAAWKHKPDSLAININLANALLKQNKIMEALRYYSIALYFHPDSAEAHYDLANVLYGVGRRDEALANYQAVVKLQPDLKEARDMVKLLSAPKDADSANANSPKP